MAEKEKPKSVGDDVSKEQSTEAEPENTPEPEDEQTPVEESTTREPKPKPHLERSRVVPTLLGVLVAIASAAALRATSSVLIPLVLAIFLCYLILPVMKFMKRFRVPEALTMPASLLLIVGMIFLLNLVVVQTVGEIQEAMPRYTERMSELSDNLIAHLGDRAELIQEVDWVSEVSNALTGMTVSIFGSVVNFVGKLVLVIMYMAFIMVGRQSILRNLGRAFSKERANELQDIVQKVNLQVQRYIAGKILVSFLTGFLMFIVLWFFDVDFALFWGLMGFLLNFIPTVGSLIAWFLPIVISLFQFGDPMKTVYVGLCLIGVQQAIGNGVEPALMGQRLNLSPLVVLFALVFFGWLWGFWGMVLSVPLMATLKIVFEHTQSLKPIAIMMEQKKN